MKTWEVLKAFSENKSIIAIVLNEEIRNDMCYTYDFISLIDGVFYWNKDTNRPFRLNDFYNVLDIDWQIQ